MNAKNQISLYHKKLMAKNCFASFATSVDGNLDMQSFHWKYYHILDKFARGEIRRLIVTMPPQHGKSTASSRLLPAFLLANDPDLKIAVASYSDAYAQRFNREVRRVIGSTEFRALFPSVHLPSGRKSDRTYPNNSREFGILGHLGGLRAVGRGGPLTGNTVDVMIMDDVYKDSMEGNSPVVRDSVWEWYLSVVKTRLHNASRELMVLTRWHEEDIIGLMAESDRVKEITDPEQIDPSFEGWYKLNFEALKESEPTPIDDRPPGRPLWPSRHSLRSLQNRRTLDPHTFECLYQGKPSSREGLLYPGGFQTYDELPADVRKKANYTDTADQGDDYLCSVCYEKGKDGLIYLTDVLYSREGMQITEDQTVDMLRLAGTREVRIESNNGGEGFARNVRSKVGKGCRIKTFHQSANKEARILTNSSAVTRLIRMPAGWERRWPLFFAHLSAYKAQFRANRWHDAPDVLTGIVETESLRPGTARIGYLV